MIRYVEQTSESLKQIAQLYQDFGYKGPIQAEARHYFAYKGSSPIGILRLVKENGYWVLRGMFVDKQYRRQGVGKNFLRFVARHIEKLDQNCYCIPYSHLESFYGTIGFKKVSDLEAPIFLVARKNQYNDLENSSYILMMKA